MKLMQEFMSTKDAKDKVKMLVLSIQTVRLLKSFLNFKIKNCLLILKAKDEDGLYA